MLKLRFRIYSIGRITYYCTFGNSNGKYNKISDFDQKTAKNQLSHFVEYSTLELHSANSSTKELRYKGRKNRRKKEREKWIKSNTKNRNSGGLQH